MKKILFLLALLLPTHALAVLSNPFYKAASTVTFFPTPYVAYSRVNGLGGESSLSVGTGTGYAKLNLGNPAMTTSPITIPTGTEGQQAPIIKLQGGSLNLTEKVNGTIVNPGKIVVVAGIVLGDVATDILRLPAFLSFANVRAERYSSAPNPRARAIDAKSVSATSVITESLTLFGKQFPTCWFNDKSGEISFEKLKLSGSDTKQWYVVCSRVAFQLSP